MRHIWVLLLVLVPAVLQAQTGGGDGARRAQLQAQRDSLEREIVARFLEDVTRELRLDHGQRARMERALKVSGERRRELMHESANLRSRLARALRDRNTTDETFRQLLSDHEALRLREHELWRRDQEDLARFLTARQQTQFIMRWAHFQDQIRDIIERRMRELRGASRQQTPDATKQDAVPKPEAAKPDTTTVEPRGS